MILHIVNLSIISTRTASRRTRKLTTQNASAPQRRKGIRKVRFNERSNQLLRFKVEFGNCNVPRGYADNPSFRNWCSDMRQAHNEIQQGRQTKFKSLSQDRIKRLEEIGFQWHFTRTRYSKAFERHCRELIAFKEEFGHCNVPPKFANNPSLGR